MGIMDGTWLFAAVVFGSVIVFLVIVIGLPTWFYHRREMMKMKGLARNDTAALGERVTALEKRCDKLEERITEAHVLLADEQRQMDRKLSAILPDSMPAGDGDAEAAKRDGKKRQRTK
jgi:hypothetical protein